MLYSWVEMRGDCVVNQGDPTGVYIGRSLLLVACLLKLIFSALSLADSADL